MAAGDTFTGRRIPVPESGDINKVIFDFEPGDYCGPIEGYSGGKPSVFFLLPNARDDSAPEHDRSVHHVASPPHVFTEQPDGSLEIRESILSSSGWHGYLDAGHVWREV